MQQNHAQHPSRRRRIGRRPYSACDGLAKFLAREFEATDYDFGWLTFPIPLTAEDVAVDGVVPEWFDKAMVHDHYSSFIVCHPDVGMFLLDEPWSLIDPDAPDTGERLRDHYLKLRRLESILQKTLFAEGLPTNRRPLARRSLDWHSALVVDDTKLVSAALTAGLAEHALLLLDDDAVLPELLQALAAVDAGDGLGPRTADAPSAQELLAPVAEHLGPCFIESEAYVAGCQLDAIGEAMQEEDGRRAAEKVGLIDYFEPPFEDDGSF